MEQKVMTGKIKKGDVFSESSHYVYQGQNVTAHARHNFVHLETGTPVSLDSDYVTSILSSGDQFNQVVKVGKEDKFWTKKQIDDLLREMTTDPIGNVPMPLPTGFEKPKEGELKLKGMRTIWEEIYSQQVFTVCFKKADEKMPKKEYEALKDAQIKEALEVVTTTASQKKGVKDAAIAALKKLQDNPISDMIEGELRVLRGYKIQFSSRDGRYDCIDVDLLASSLNTPKSYASSIRPVNINTIQWLIFNGIKYELEK